MEVSGVAQRQELLIVSNRLPVTVAPTGAGYQFKPSVGGLATALSGARDRPFLWVGWPGTHVRTAEHTAVSRQLREVYGCVPVFLTHEEIDGFYNRFSNGTLWPLLHYLPESSQFDLDAWKAYQDVNRRFAAVIEPLLHSDAIVWVHDYHLMLLPGWLRQRVPGAKIGFFLHVPFPSSEVYRLLPVRSEILEGLLGADTIGFHTYDYLRHFRSACMRVLGARAALEEVEWKGRSCRLAVNPIGIDADHFRRLADEPATVAELARLRREFAGRRVLLGVDRMDYSKGLEQKLHAFERLLDGRPDWASRVVLLQVAVPSRTAVGRYQQLRRDIEELVGHINGLHGSVGHTPVQFLFQSVAATTLSALYQLADVCWVSSIRDGMNLVCQEFVASQPEDHVGALVLSEFAGAASSLEGALLVNPWNADEMADAVRRALEMPEAERRRRHAQMNQTVTTHSSAAWARRFIDEVERSSRRALKPSPCRPLLERLDELVADCLGGRRRYFFLDYGGTLEPVSSAPRERGPSRELLAILYNLVRCPRSEVYVLSSESAATLERWLGHLSIGLCAEHGHALRPAGEKQWQTLVPAETGWMETVLPVMESFAARSPGAQVEQKAVGLAWHWQDCKPESGKRQANELAWHLCELLANAPVEVIHARQVVEVRAQGVTKAALATHLASRMSPRDFVLAVGGDRSDEELFGELPARAWSCSVGRHSPQAVGFVERPSDVLRILGELIRNLPLDRDRTTRRGTTLPTG